MDVTYDLIRGSNPAPGAWTTLAGRTLQIFDCRKHLARTFGAVKGRIGEVTDLGASGFCISAQGGRIEVLKAKAQDTKKLGGAELAAAVGITNGSLLGT